MSRKYLDEEEDFCLRNGVKRIGYDANTEQYTFRSTDTGRVYISQPGQKYGPLQATSEHVARDPHNETDEDSELSWPNVLPLVAAAGGGLWWLVSSTWTWGTGGEAKAAPKRMPKDDNYGSFRYVIRQGDSCDYIAMVFGTTTSRLQELNPGLNWDKLRMGHAIRVPSTPSAW